ncbi:glycosyltransferase family 39 protein [Paludisphaera borealis]|uniref:Glycosyltransferase RgtA/B/C/D-like domain-containing protein n=1 Tax=Paludisphaera borealis TaxID=1387353 RepID=A0A1U7CMS6_9BACT|nr:glycosyltransferase family 39 protein [Paludisphaera borealis]APW60221.1 hypothetical protein BSF38_01687 [Paludisphaera borealis]
MVGRSRWIALGLVVAAVLVRVAAVLVLQSHHVPRSTFEHGEIAASIVAGRGFSMQFLGAEGPTSQQAPVYPAIVALAYAAGGVEQPRALLMLELGQALLGGLLVLGVLRLTSRVVPDCPAAAWTAGAIAAFHPTLVYATTYVQVAALAATLVVWILVWAARTAESRSIRDAAIVGALLALAALTDPILGLVGAGVLVAIAAGSMERRRAVGLAAVVALTSAIGIAPWVVRNAIVHGEFVPIKSTFGYAFWQGNCAISEGTDKVVRASVDRIFEAPGATADLSSLNATMWRARHEAGYIDDIAMSNEFKRHLGTLSEPERSGVLLRMATAEIKANPLRYLQLCLRRLQYFWLFDETNPKTRVWIYRVSHLGLTALALAGLMLAAPTARRRLAPTIATAAVLSVFHALTIVSARFHIPIEPLMAVWAGAGVSGLRAPHWIKAIRSTATAHHVERIGVVSRLG